MMSVGAFASTKIELVYHLHFASSTQKQYCVVLYDEDRYLRERLKRRYAHLKNVAIRFSKK